MATDKRFIYSTQEANKEYPNPVRVPLPTTSANNQHIVTNRNANILNYCYHQAATRSLLLQSQDNGSSSSSGIGGTEESDESATPPPHYYEIPGTVPAFKGRTSGPPPSYDDVVNPNAPPPSYQSLFGQVREARKSSNGFVDLLRQLFLILIGTLGCTMIIGFLLLIPITMILVGIIYVNDCRAENIPSFLVIGGLVWIVKNVLSCYNQFKKDSNTINRPPPRRTPIATRSSSSSTSSSSSSSSSSTTINISSSASSASNNNPSQFNSTSSSHNSDTQTDTSSATSSTSSSPSATSSPSTAITSTTTRLRRTREQQESRIRQPSLIGITSFKCESMLNYFLVVWFTTGCIIVYRIYEPDYDNPSSMSYCNRTVYLYAFWLITSAFIAVALVLSCLCCLMASSLISCNHGR